jgi:hypothetical protein
MVAFDYKFSSHSMFLSNQIYTKKKLSIINVKSLPIGKLVYLDNTNFIMTCTK